MVDSRFRKHVPFIGEVTLWLDEVEGKVHASFLGEHTRAVRMSTRAETSVGQALQMEMAHSRLQPLREAGIEVTIQPNHPASAMLFTPDGAININDGGTTLNIITDMGSIAADVALDYASRCLRIIEVLGYGRGKRVEFSHPMLAAADKLLIHGRSISRIQVETASAGLVTLANIVGQPAYLIRPTDPGQVEFAHLYLQEVRTSVVYGQKVQPLLIVDINGLKWIGAHNEATLISRFPGLHVLDLTKTMVRLSNQQGSIVAELSGKDVSLVRTLGWSPVADDAYLLMSVLNSSALVQAKKSPYRLAELIESDDQESAARDLESSADDALAQMLTSGFGLEMIKKALLRPDHRDPFIEIIGADQMVIDGNSMRASQEEVAQAKALMDLLRKS